MFRYCLAQLIENGRLTSSAKDYLSDDRNESFLRRLVAQYPNQFNTVIETIRSIDKYHPLEHEQEIFEAVQDLGTLTPIIFKRYRQADTAGRKELARRIRELKPKFFQNVPIGNILPRKDQEILTEMVYAAYKPIGMSFSEVTKFLEELEDHTEDLDRFSFPPTGYDFHPLRNKVFQLKPGETIDSHRVHGYKELFRREGPKTEQEVKDVGVLIERLAKAGTEFSDDELERLFSVMGSDEMIRRFRERSVNTSDHHQLYGVVNGLRELLGVYMEDNFTDRLEHFLSSNPSIDQRIGKILSLADRVATLQRKMGKEGSGIAWSALDNRSARASALSAFVRAKVIKQKRQDIERIAQQFVSTEASAPKAGAKRVGGLKACISKNVGSFFAKASAGICTADDIKLFNREDHFHINIVEDDETVRGNNQAYLITEADGSESLVLRGFNPNSDFLELVDAQAYCEEVLRVAREFMEKNQLNNLYITESLGEWHALSNRAEVQQYLVERYTQKKRAHSYTLAITAEKSVHILYKV